LSLLKGRDIYFVPDLQAGKLDGVKCMGTLKDQVGNIAKHAKLVNLRTFLKENGATTPEKVDLSEAVELWADKDGSFVSHLAYFSDAGIYREGNIF